MDPKARKKLPYGNCNFEDVITDNYIYVDKTRYIEMLENESNKNIFFTRPRKFGKSLFLMMLYTYYDVNNADRFDMLFGNLYIGKHPTPKKTDYLVLNLDFSGLDTSDEKGFLRSFAVNIEGSVRSFLNHYSNLLPDGLDNARKLLDNMFQYGVSSLDYVFSAAEQLNKKLFIIIDEYDHFANDLIARSDPEGIETYKRMVRANGSVRDFYEKLKKGGKTLIDRILLTGVTPIMLDDITSGFNIADNLSLNAHYNEALGFTHDEVKAVMEELNIDRSLITVDLERYYNGYLFHPDGEHKVYNPTMVFYILLQIMDFNKMPKSIVDSNLKMDYTKVMMLIKANQNRQQLLRIADEGGAIAEVIERFSIEQLHNPQCFTSLLFYLGLLTIDNNDNGLSYLKIPNYSVHTLYWEYITQVIYHENKSLEIDVSKLSLASLSLAREGDAAPFINYIMDNIVSRLSVRDLRKFDEKYLKIIILNNLFYTSFFTPVSEFELSGGYSDIYLHRGYLHPELPYEWVFELKYIKKSDSAADLTVIETARKAAREQLARYRASHFFSGRTDVRFLSVIFVGKDKVIIEESLPAST
jgi:hypothetical protein